MSVRTWTWGDDPAPLRGCLDRGGVLAIPTESSYGLAADPTSRRGCEQVLEIKGRPASKALPIVIPDRGGLDRLPVIAAAPGLDVVAALWPAALSLVVHLESTVPAAGGGDSLAVRVPDHAGLRRLLALLDRPLTATSANRSGEPPVLTIEPLRELLKGFDSVVVDDGARPGGPPSTLVRWAGGGFELLRRGRVPFALLDNPT